MTHLSNSPRPVGWSNVGRKLQRTHCSLFVKWDGSLFSEVQVEGLLLINCLVELICCWRKIKTDLSYFVVWPVLYQMATIKLFCSATQSVKSNLCTVVRLLPGGTRSCEKRVEQTFWTMKQEAKQDTNVWRRVCGSLLSKPWGGNSCESSRSFVCKILTLFGLFWRKHFKLT